jgi:DNA replication protein DnaC
VKPADIPLDTLFRRLHLANAPRIYRALAEKAEQEQWSYRDFLAVLVAEEIAHRQQTRVQRLTRRARFPFLKTVDEFDFTYQSTLRLSLLGSALSPDFVSEGRSLILSGKSGRGKTHLAVAVAYRAIQNGFEARFTTAAALIDELSRASRDGRLVDALLPYTHPALLVIDEVGYLSYGTDAANVLFHVVNDRHLRRRSMVFTTNKPLDAWGRVLHDPDLAAAIVDRILERGRILRLDGPSLRTKHLGLDDPTLSEASTLPAGVSGISRQEFPEPTGPIRADPSGTTHARASVPRGRRGSVARMLRERLRSARFAARSPGGAAGLPGLHARPVTRNCGRIRRNVPSASACFTSSAIAASFAAGMRPDSRA